MVKKIEQELPKTELAVKEMTAILEKYQVTLSVQPFITPDGRISAKLEVIEIPPKDD